MGALAVAAAGAVAVIAFLLLWRTSTSGQLSRAGDENRGPGSQPPPSSLPPSSGMTLIGIGFVAGLLAPYLPSLAAVLFRRLSKRKGDRAAYDAIDASLRRGSGSAPSQPLIPYGMDHTLLNLRADTLWLNMGLWTTPDQTFASACEALALKVAEGCLEENARIIDFGSGCGDQVLLFARLQPTATIYTVSLEPVHSRTAHARVAAAGLVRRVTVLNGDAADPDTWVALGGDDSGDSGGGGGQAPQPGSCTAALAVDAAYHFRPRARFLAAARALLKPATGRLHFSTVAPPGRQRLPLAAIRAPPARQAALRDALSAGGFVGVEVEDARALDGWVAPAKWRQYEGLRWFAEWANRSGKLRFVVVRARRAQEGEEVQ
ncbi:S-adenosyl-L-methionine-dependent methyltransferase [Zopfochytrium polystomum]|nr:S-adenosyl-L-methionine-dependent methyltransferase [Zopfochytrium polystomum]